MAKAGLAVSGHTRSNPHRTAFPSRDAGAAPVANTTGTTDAHILDRLNELVVDRFARLTGLRIVMTPIGAASSATDSELAGAIPEPARHPDCAAFPCDDYCRDKWAGALRQARLEPETQWHRCKFGLLCAIVPVVCEGRPLAVCQLVCAQSSGEAQFERFVEMLDVLIENYLARDAEYLARRISGKPDKADIGALNPAVRNALAHIERNLHDPGMTVASVARHVKKNPSYLAHLFAQQTGVRMSRHIAQRRLELARTLLAETDWQIKRIAIETGHANADWFSHLFHLSTGVTPTKFRIESRGSV